MDVSQTKAFRFGALGFAGGAIAFAAIGNWLLAIAFVLIAIAFLVNSTENVNSTEDRSEPQE